MTSTTLARGLQNSTALPSAIEGSIVRSRTALRVARLIRWRTACVVCLFCAATAFAKTNAVYTKLVDFTGPNGYYPGALVQGTDGNLYGPAYGPISGPPGHHTYGYGLIFKMTPAGELTTLYTFCAQANCLDGETPNPLILATDGKFYGTTVGGGAYSNTGGTVFRITPAGRLTTLYSFCARADCADGSEPYASLVQGTDRNFYGTTYSGGTHAKGTVFKITPTGELTTLHSFCSLPNCADGINWINAGLVQGNDGSFYGTTNGGGAHAGGTIFKITSSGKLTTLYSFCTQAGCADGDGPQAGLVQATDGNFYGTTAGGGATNLGTFFRITPGGTLTTLHSFCTQQGCPDGYSPQTVPVQGTDGNFYGTTNFEIFSITPGGTLTVLHNAGGTSPNNALVQATNGVFYSTTQQGGTKAIGSAYSLSVGLGPFVETLPTSGVVGQTIKILGQGFTGTTHVSFNGTSASYTVVSDTYLKAHVPTGAMTGWVKVVTPGGTLTSNKPFVVKP